MHRLFILVLLGVSVGCAKTGQTATAAAIDTPPPILEKHLADGKVMQQIDLNADRTADVYNTFVERSNGNRTLEKKEMDVDFDGRIDQVTYYDEAGAIERQEMDRDFDGRFDWIDHFEAGERIMTEMDSNRDGRMDMFTYYERPDAGGAPRITRKERDTDGDGRIDYWERYDATGSVVKTGRDTDRDGIMDERDY